MRWLPAVLLLAACGDPAAWQRALAIERQIQADSPGATYADPRYIHVMRALRDVPRGSPDRARAEALWQRVSDGRRIAAVREHPGVDGLPARLRGVPEPLPPGAERASRPPPESPAAPGTAAAPAAPGGVAALAPEVRSRLHVTLYSAAWCGYCKQAKRWLTTLGVPFDERDIERDAGAAEEHRAAGRGYRGVPLLVVGDRAIRGFDRPKLESALLAQAAALTP